MDNLERNPIKHQSWEEFRTNIKSCFTIAHTGNHLLIKFFSEENELCASVRKTNDKICNDNCVEAFIAFDNEVEYYNLEFNCFGNAKIAYGGSRDGRKLLLPETIAKIKTQSSIDTTINNEGMISWEILLIIPKELFEFTPIKTFEGIIAKANFYKCGDGLTKPHFLTWNKVETTHPDFHQPQYFGDLKFLNK
ncbi:carbohydrate-binding family 9-like protein [Pedobacter alpinus]|uniref:Carbohydrate-binding family 9-like protein n=2 Tax=Pedobacter alpinus TaxID=1590643 RepID=A0ABW5TUK7_9SPHI